MKRCFPYLLVVVLFHWVDLCRAQSDDAAIPKLLEQMTINSGSQLLNKTLNDALNSVRRNPTSNPTGGNVLIEKGEERFKHHEGKIIRYIYVQHYGFERSLSDTSNRLTYFGSKVINALHTNTREFVIRQNLFMRENTKLNAFELADNERYLRTLNLIQDARIFTVPVASSEDSIDILIITKDHFTLSAEVDGSVNSLRLRVTEANLAGMAQRVQATGTWENNRNPQFGTELLYSKSNIGGSFVDGTVAYSQIDGGRSDGTEPESAFLIRLHRPLVSPFSHVAGGLELSFNNAQNLYNKPDSLFFNYRYNFYDFWLGYNLGTNKLYEYANYNNRRTRVFLSGRYFKADYKYTPRQIGERFDPIYNTRQAALAQLSVFRQDFYKLNYIFGFGTTEDVPQGYSASLTAGWHRQLHLERPYGGFQMEHYLVTPKGAFINTSFKAGGFLHNGTLQDASTLASVNFYTQLMHYKKWKIRQYAKISFTQLSNRVTYEPLRINNTYGLDAFRTDSITGTRRTSIYSETILFLHKKILGFRFAPFVFGDFTLVSAENESFEKSDGYTGIGAGIRTRNENLTFGTIELKAVYFPRAVFDLPQFRLMVSSNLRFRYRSDFIRPPNIIHLNRDDI